MALWDKDAGHDLTADDLGIGTNTDYAISFWVNLESNVPNIFARWSLFENGIRLFGAWVTDEIIIPIPETPGIGSLMRPWKPETKIDFKQRILEEDKVLIQIIETFLNEVSR